MSKELNQEQRAVVDHTSGPLAVLAGAGTGKTKAIIQRIARLVREGVRPDRILAVTFSRKAADEMKERLEREERLYGVDVVTWHSLARRILVDDHTPHGKRIASRGLAGSPPGQAPKAAPGPDAGKAARVRKAISRDCANWTDCDVKAFLRFLTKVKANLFSPEDPLCAEAAEATFPGRGREAIAAYHFYELATEQEGAVPFDDMLVHTANHLLGDAARARWSARWDFVLQDEGQDSNRVQAVIAWALARDHQNYMIVGDPGQSLYSFRCSSPSTLMAFAEDWNADVVRMVMNYRCGVNIVDLANTVIRPCAVALGADLVAARPDPGAVTIRSGADASDESTQIARFIADRVGVPDLPGLAGKRATYKDFAVLYRLNARSGPIEDALRTHGIPYLVAGDQASSFYEQREVQVVLAYLRIALDRATQSDFTLSIQTPTRYLNRAFLDQARTFRDEQSWPDAVRSAARRGPPRAAAGAVAWSDLIDRVAAAHQKGQRVSVLIDEVLSCTHYLALLDAEEAEEDDVNEDSPSANVRALVAVAARFADGHALLDFADDTIRADKRARSRAGDDAVKLMSVHRAKGMEWPFVWLAGVNEGVLPHKRGLPGEERRIFYVAVTRAKNELVISYTQEKDAPSSFLVEAGLVEEHA